MDAGAANKFLFVYVCVSSGGMLGSMMVKKCIGQPIDTKARPSARVLVCY